MYYDSVKEKTKARELLPEEDVWFGDGRMRREEGDDGVGVGGGDGGEEGGGMEGAGVEEVGGLCEVGNISNRVYRCEDWRVRTSTGFEGVGTEGKNVG
jgi:hypothetical protein